MLLFQSSLPAQRFWRAKEQIRQKKVNEISQRLVALLDSQKQEKTPTPPESGTYLTRLVVKSGGRVFFLKTAEIDWIEAADYYVYLHVGGKSHLLRETMNALEKQLDPRKFQRLHRSTIVNLDRLKELQPYAHGDYSVILHDGTSLKLSRNYRPKLETALGALAMNCNWQPPSPFRCNHPSSAANLFNKTECLHIFLSSLSKLSIND